MEEKSLQEEEKKAGNGLLSRPRKHRITTNLEFREIFRSGKRRAGKNLILIFVEKEGFKFGITFQKGSKPAVKRNRTKRRLKEIIRMKKELVGKNIRMVILVLPTGLDLSFSQLSDEVDHLLMDAALI